MHLLSPHRSLGHAQSLMEDQRPLQALEVIERFIAVKQARLPRKRCSRLNDAIFLRDHVIRPACPASAGQTAPAPQVRVEATGSIHSEALSALSSYAHASQDSLFAVPLAPPLAPCPRPLRQIPPNLGLVRPRVRPPSVLLAQPRPLSGLSDVSVLSEASLDRAVVSEATIAHLRPVVFQTLHFVPSRTELAAPR